MGEIQVIDRVVAILGTLAAGGAAPMQLADVARDTGLSRSTAHRLLSSLEQHGLCERFEGGRYQLGLRLFELGSIVLRRLDLRERGRPELDRLARETDLTAFLCLRDRDRAVCIERVDGRFAHSLALQLGGSLPLHLGAAPRVLLAFAPPAEIERYLKQAAAGAYGPDADPALIRAELEQVRARGWSLSDGDVNHGAAAIGAPIVDHRGELAAAVSISGLRPHVMGERMEELAATVVRVGVAISHRLGLPERLDGPASIRRSGA